MLSSCLCLELTSSRELAKVIDRRAEQGGQFMQWQEMCRAFHAGFQVEIEGLFHGQSYEVYQRSILTDMRLLQGLNITRTPFSEHESRWVPVCWLLGISVLEIGILRAIEQTSLPKH